MFKVKEGIELFGDAELRHPTGDYGSVEIDGGPGTSGYEGYSIGGRSVFMHDNSVTSGIYNDVNNHWLWRGVHGGSSYMYYNGGIQLSAESGYALAHSQMRAPIYYDSNNTAYYLDLAGTSRLSRLAVGGNDHSYETSQAAIRMANSVDQHNYIVSNATGWNSWNQWIRYIAGVNTWRIGTFDYDNNGTGASVWRLGGKNRAGGAEINYIVAGPRGGSTNAAASSWTDRVVLYNAYNRTASTGPYGDGTQYRVLDEGWARAPIFYDTDNTAYYADPASTSRLNVVKAIGLSVDGTSDPGGSGLRIIGNYDSNHTWLIHSGARYVFGRAHDWTQSFDLYLGSGTSGSGTAWAELGQRASNTTNGTWRGISIRRKTSAGNVLGDLQANEAYLSRAFINNGGYADLIVGSESRNGDTFDVERPTLQLRGGQYPHLTLDASLTNAGGVATNTNHGPVISFLSNLSGGTGFRRWSFGAPSRDASALSWGVYDNNANPHYGLGGDLGWSSYGSKMWLNTGGHLQTTGSMRSPIFYDSNDTSYYVDPTSSSHVKHIEVAANTASSLYYNAAIEVRETNYGGSQTDSWAYAPRIGLHWGGRVASQIALGSNGRVHILNNPGNDNEDFQAKVVYADKLVDRNDNNYYVDPNDSNFSAQLAGTVNANQGFSTEGGSLRITHPGGASYATSTSTVTGAMKITLPVGYTNTMLRFTIKVYEYTTGESYEINVGGYNYATGWVNPSAYIVAQPGTNRNHTVRFGFDGSKCCVYVGETSSTWSYPQVTVSDFEAGYSNYGRDMWNNGWSIGFVTSFGTITQTLSNVQIGRTQAIVYDRDNSSYYIDSASTSRLNAITANKIHCVGSATNTAPRWDTSFHVTQSQHFYGHNSTQTMYIGESNHIHIRNIGQAAGDFRAPVFYDSNNTGYYTDPASTSRLNVVNANSYLVNGAPLEAGAKNGIFWENNTTITSSYTLTAGKNAGTFGPITIANNVTVTVPDGCTWTIV